MIHKLALCILFLATSLNPTSAKDTDKNAVRSTILVESVAADSVDHEQPCFIVFPEGPSLALLQSAQLPQSLSTRLEKLGYHLVSNPEQATVFVKVELVQADPFQAEVQLQGKGRYDYSHSASTRNYAATLSGGRYQSLGNPDRARARNETGFILDPEGKPIDIGNQPSYEAEYKEGETETQVMTLYPSLFQVSAWSFENGTPAEPTQLWATRSTLETLVEEPIADQVEDLANATLKHLAKPLKSPKEIRRKR